MTLVSSMKFVTPIVFKWEHISGATQKGGRDLWWLIFHPYTYEINSNPLDNNPVKFCDDTIRNEKKCWPNFEILEGASKNFFDSVVPKI